VGNLAESIMTGMIVLLGILSARTEERIPYHMDMCVVRHDGTKITMDIWSDFAERYEYHYPGSYRGKCK